jgi:hypothetical protein
VRLLLGLLPAAACVLLTVALRPAGGVFAPLRLAIIRAALVVAGVAALQVEALSLVHGLTAPVLVLTWSVVVVVAGGALALRYRPDDPPGAAALISRARASWRLSSWAQRITALALLVLVLAELVVAVASPPDNYDSQTYHLPRIEHWVLQRNVQFFPTEIDRQASMAPGAEFLLLHLRLLIGDDSLYNLLQFSAGLGCVLLASRIAGQLGGSGRAQLLAGFVAGTAPIVALEATSTQTDLVTAAWVGCLATLVLDELHHRTPPFNLVLLGAATGLSTLTKATGLLASGPLLLVWAVAQVAQARLARRGLPAGRSPHGGWRIAGRAAVGGAMVLGCAALIAGPNFVREGAEFGSPLGPDYLRTSISLQRHDPASVLVNALRIGYTALDTPLAPLNAAVSHGIIRLSDAIGVDPNDPKTTFTRSTFPTVNWAPNEDTASLPVAGTLVLLGAGFVLVAPRRRVPAGHAVAARVYAAAFWVNVLLYVAIIKWQPWGNRLVLYLVMLGAPLAGLWLDMARRRHREAAPGGSAAWRASRATRSTAALLTALTLVATGCTGLLSVGYGWPRRLVGPHSVFVVSDMQARFQLRPQWQADYEWAAAAVRASGAHRVGLVQSPDAWEYPWWVLLPGRDILALQSVLPGLPPAQPNQVDAIVCEVTQSVCASFAPVGWLVHERDSTGYAVPGGSPAEPASPRR